MKHIFTVDAADAGTRLDAWLAKLLPEVSRSRIQKWIKAGEVLVDGKRTTSHQAIRATETVTVDAVAPAEEPTGIKPRHDIPLDIVYEDDVVVVLNKPSGLLVHPATTQDTATLAHALVAHWPQIASVGESPDRPGIMQRLDKDASGLMVVAKTKKAFDSLKRQFQKHSISKEYAVLVEGGPTDDEGTIRLHIGRKRNTGRMAARHKPREGDKEAVTHYYVEERFNRVTLLTIRTETGRTHQIRAHMDAIGCPVVGDSLYGLKRPARFPLPRLFLHAKSLGFTHPVTRRKLAFTAPLPPELDHILQKLRA